VEYIRKQFAVSERRACEILGQPRSSNRYEPRPDPYDEKKLLAVLQHFTTDHPRAGYRRFWTELQREGISISLKVTYRLWTRHRRP
jgi:putative transposase